MTVQGSQAAVEAFFAILLPSIIEQTETLKEGGAKLVHYTSAENALNIIRNERFWLRNVSCMNDYSEVQHGINLLLHVFNDNENARMKRLVEILDCEDKHGAQEAVNLFNDWIPSLPNNVYIGCLSLYDPADVDGRLSMWRAYASGRGGVALVMSVTPFLVETDLLKAYSLPVSYLGDEQFATAIDKCLDALGSAKELYEHLEGEQVRDIVFWWLVSLSVSLKHPAFQEEQEWRIIYIPSMNRSAIIEEAVESVGGVPQIVQKIPLINDPGNGLVEADLGHLFEKLIIGPCDFPIVLRDAFAAELQAKGIEAPHDRILNSFIPLR